MHCRVVTWNVHSWVGSDGRYDPLRTAQVLAVLGADVIGLQEVDWRQGASDEPDPLELVAGHLGMNAVAGPNLRDHRGQYGNGLLTRFDVDVVRRLDLACGRREPRGAIDAELSTPLGPLRALVTHLGLSWLERRRQARALRDAVNDGPDHPTVLLGDLNEWRPARFVPPPLVPDPFAVSASGRTYPSRLPWFRLDHVLVRPGPARLTCEVVRTAAARAASDHLPLVAEIEWGAA